MPDGTRKNNWTEIIIHAKKNTFYDDRMIRMSACNSFAEQFLILLLWVHIVPIVQECDASKVDCTLAVWFKKIIKPNCMQQTSIEVLSIKFHPKRVFQSTQRSPPFFAVHIF